MSYLETLAQAIRDYAAAHGGPGPGDMEVGEEDWALWCSLAGVTADKPYDLGLVACSAAKLDHAAPARDLYTGDLFKRALAVAEAQCARVVILSARHHVLELDALVEPYDTPMPTLKAERSRWMTPATQGVATVLNRLVGKSASRPGRVLNLAGAKYSLGWSWTYFARRPEVVSPLAGLGIGRQKAKLVEMLQGQRRAA